ncbi:MAG: hypothetical protein ACNI26_11735 [Terasakiella sp.]|uniref:hypothetical protein n=1 Tax=unclassified Terasakiella TaxID=2614952 RepID=UPI003B0072AD
MKIFALLRNLMALVGVIGVLIIAAGIYKFNIVGDDVVIGDEPDEQAGIIFSQAAGKWFDHIGVCHTCTPENGFGKDGSLELKDGVVVWKELRLKVMNKAGGVPSVAELKQFFDTVYTTKKKGFQSQVFFTNAVFDIYVPVDQGIENKDFMKPDGALLRKYIVTEIPYDKNPGQYIANHAERLARSRAVQTEIFQQDGYGLKLDHEYRSSDRVFVYSFKHYGDPEGKYSIKIRVKENGLVVVE